MRNRVANVAGARRFGRLVLESLRAVGVERGSCAARP